MTQNSDERIGDVSSIVKILGKIDNVPDSIARKRQLMADVCKLLGTYLGQDPLAGATAKLSPRMAQTLRALLAGDSEKQVAARLGVSRHTVHVYVKALYKHFKVSSRGELLARFVGK